MKVDFSAKYSCENGEVLLVTGGHESIGNWNVKDALVLEMGDGEIYEGTAELPDGAVEYKYLIAYPELGEVKWESGNNRLVLLVEENVSVSDVPFLDGFGSAMKCELPASVYNKQNGHVEQDSGEGDQKVDHEVLLSENVEKPPVEKVEKPFWKFWQSDEDFAKEQEMEKASEASNSLSKEAGHIGNGVSG